MSEVSTARRLTLYVAIAVVSFAIVAADAILSTDSILSIGIVGALWFLAARFVLVRWRRFIKRRHRSDSIYRAPVRDVVRMALHSRRPSRPHQRQMQKTIRRPVPVLRSRTSRQARARRAASGSGGGARSSGGDDDGGAGDGDAGPLAPAWHSHAGALCFKGTHR